MDTGNFNFIVETEEARQRLDQFLRNHLKDHSRSQIQKWIKQGAVLCDGSSAQSSLKLKSGQTIQVRIPEEELTVVPESIPIDVLYEDAHLLVVNKSAGMVTHPSAGHRTGTMVHAIAHHLKGKVGDLQGLRPGVVHRLDKDTSGVLVFAKTTQVLEKLARQFRDRTVEKVYHAIVCGKVQSRQAEIVGPVGRAFRSPKMEVTSAGRLSETQFKVLKRFDQYTYVEVYPKTGRTHQIRVHLSKIGHAVVGDKMYGGLGEIAERQMLHAYRLTIRHPMTNKKLTFTAPIPKDFKKTLQSLRVKSSSGV